MPFTVVTAGRTSGSGEIRIDADGTRHSFFTFNDRGRGPEVHADLALSPDGNPRTLVVRGHNYLHAPADETLEVHGDKLAWKSSSEHGEAAADGFYVANNEALATTALLAHQLAVHKRVKLLPAGEAWLEDSQVVAVEGKPLTEIAIAGLGFTPQLVWLDGNGDLFAEVSPWISLVRAGNEALLPDLIAADQKWLAARAAKLATTLAKKPAALAFTHAAVFDAEQRTLLADRTVVVVGDRITAVGDASTAIPPGAQVIDAHGKTLLPGLWDMHTHSGDGDGIFFLASGVTTVRDLGNEMKDLLARVARFDSGAEVGPRVVRAGLVDGPGKLASPAGLLAGTPDEAVAAVNKYADAGYVQIKMYSSLDPKLVPLVAKAAHARGMRVSGHIPNGMRASEAVEAGYDEIQHVNMLFLQFLARPGDDTRTPLRFTRVAEGAAALDLDGKDVTAFLDLLVAHHTVIDPTLATFEGMFISDPGELPPLIAPYIDRLPAQVARGARGGGLDAPGDKRATYRASYKKLVELVGRAYKRGIPIVAGTDDTAGLSLPRELELYVEAGVPAPDVLAMATLGAARVMHLDGDRGTIAVGKQADLVLVAGDPTRDIGAVRNTDVVVCRGIVYDPAALFTAVGMKPRAAH
jgi:imidazolonepropionase-like amidohydrolase